MLPEMPTGAQRRHENAYLHPDYAYKRRVVVQLLKDAHLYFTGRGSNGTAPSSAPEGHWNLNGEVLDRQKNDDVARSHRIVAKELEVLKKISPFYSAIATVFLEDGVSHTTYELLKIQSQGDAMAREKRKAEQEELAEVARPKKLRDGTGPQRDLPTDGKTDSMRLFDAVEIGIHQLTERLLDVDLYCVFPETEVKTGRRESTEEKYLRLAKVFDRHCREISKTRKRFRNRAYDATAAETGESRNTIERAIHYRDNDPNHGQKHRRANEAKKCAGRAVTPRDAVKGETERIDEELVDERLFYAAHGRVHPDAELFGKEGE